MPKEYPRSRRIAEQIQRELAEIIRLEFKDPRVRLLTLTGVDVTSDYSHATVFFSSLGDQEQIQSCLQGLEHGKGFLRRELARRIGLRVIPELHFRFDASVERGVRLSQLIDEAVASDERWPTADE